MYTLPFIIKLCTKIKDSSLKKSDIKKVEINKMLLDCNLIISTRILVCIVRVYTKKGKYLLEETNELLMKLGTKKEKTVRKKVEVVEEDVYISDIVIPTSEIQEEVRYDDHYADHDLAFDNDNFDNVGGDSSTLVKDFNIPTKRRKVEDKVIEYETKYYKDIICNTKMRDLRPVPTFNFNIPSFFNERLRVTVEKMRDQTVLEEHNEMSQYDDIDDYPINSDNTSHADNTTHADDDINVDDNTTTYFEEDQVIPLPIILEDIPSPFNFNDQVEPFSKEEKARLFFDLLKKASIGKIQVKQDNPQCSIIISSTS